MYLDILLKDAKILPDQINGYQKELLSDFSTANAVRTSQADAALGAESVIQVKIPDFIPLLKAASYVSRWKRNPRISPRFFCSAEIIHFSEFSTTLRLQNGCTPPEPEKSYIYKRESSPNSPPPTSHL